MTRLDYLLGYMPKKTPSFRKYRLPLRPRALAMSSRGPRLTRVGKAEVGAAWTKGMAMTESAAKMVRDSEDTPSMLADGKSFQ